MVLDWYWRGHRPLPWRAPPGMAGDPYRVWLSEIMLQQTTVAAVIPYFGRFLEAWPTVGALAAAELDAVLRAWAGLGYYARARNLHACAREVAGRFGGRFPETEAALRELPGIGLYTAAAIAAIAFGRPATVVDGNVERVVARLFAVTEPLPAVRPHLRALAETLTPDRDCGDFAQAMMDLGATVCTPRRPRCLACPLVGVCAAAAAGIAESLPRRAVKAERPTRRGVAYWLEDGEEAVLLRRRVDTGLLGGMIELPSTEWAVQGAPDADSVAGQAPVRAAWRALPGTVRHTFTHFHLELTLVAAGLAGPGAASGAGGFWVPVARLGEQALPSVMQKLIRHALAETGRDARATRKT
jgi:A/G-specific adenine glycosylase